MKKYLFFVAILLCVLFIGCEKKDSKSFIEEYEYYYNEENIPEDWTWFNKEEYAKSFDDCVFVKSDFNEVKKAITGKDRIVVYFGFNPAYYQCPYCVVCLPIANEAAKEADIKEILYLDIYQMRTDNSEEYQWLYNYVVEQIPDFGSRISVPDYFVFNDGKIESHHCATLTYKDDEGKTKYYKELTSELRQELKELYINMFTK